MHRRPAFELAGILEKHKDTLHTLTSNSWQLRTLHAIRKCRTAALGGHIDLCDRSACSTLHISYNSCRNRHCPKCQGHLREQWIQARHQELLHVPYYHIVFTLPDSFNSLCLQKPALIYSILFKTAWQVVRQFAADPKFLGATTGMIAVLHTWGQNLSLHPHLHCIVPGGGLAKSEKWRYSKNKDKFLFPVKAMSNVFRAKFMAELRKEVTIASDVSKKAFAKKWVVYCKSPFLGPKQVIEYLGRYTHKIAISNHRIVGLDKDKVSFSAKDYRKGGKKQILTLCQKEFIRRYSLHILPKGLVRIRHYGILSSSSKGKMLDLARKQTGEVAITGSKKESLFRVCPCCRKGKLVTIMVFDQRGPPAKMIEKIKNQKLK